MGEIVKVFGFEPSPYSTRVLIALKLKGIHYEYKEENLGNQIKSDELLKYNHVTKKIPVLLHNGKPLAESIVIVEYIDELWKGPCILPEDPYAKAMARFWAKFIEDKCIPAILKAFSSEGEEEIEEARELLKTLEKQLEGKKFFGGDSIGLVDIVADFIGYWVGVIQEVTEIELVNKDKFPKLTEWMDEFSSLSIVKESLPPRDALLTFYGARYPKP